MAHKQIYYSDKYFDEHYEYRHVMLPRELSKQVPKTHLMSEEEWRRLGVQQSLGWVHYMIHEPGPELPGVSGAAWAGGSALGARAGGRDSRTGLGLPGGIKLSADVKPFVPKLSRLNVAWKESSEACIFPGCAATYYSFVQEPPGAEQKIYTEDVAFGASAFPPQYLSSGITLHPYAFSPYTLASVPDGGPVPGSQYSYSQPSGYHGLQAAQPRNEHACPLRQETKALTKKKTYVEKKTCDEPKLDSARADGTTSSAIRSSKGSHHLPVENSLKSDGSKRTDRKSRITAKSGSTSKPEFEFTRLDFPELQGPEDESISEIRKHPKWGPVPSASPGISLLGEVGKPPAVLPETLPTGLSPAPKNVPSTINVKTVASAADPKSVGMSSSELSSSDPSCSREKHPGHPTKKSKVSQGGDLEQNETSRRNKKKKEKSKPKYETLTVQEPPRIEDAEEFPNLAVASERRDRVDAPKFQPTQNPQSNFKNSTKKSQIPVQLDLGGMLTALEKKQHSQHAKQSSKPVVFSVGAVPVLSKEAMSGERGHRFSQVKTPHNPLDSSAPLMKKGKQREVPKAKKPTSLKKRLQENAASPALASDGAPDVESGDDDQVPEAEPTVGAVPVLSKEAMSGERGHRFSQVKTPHNPLDSSAPLMKKGKQREVPKAKKPTSLKKPHPLFGPGLPFDGPLHEMAPGICSTCHKAAAGPRAVDELASCTPAIEDQPEEPLGTEQQRDTGAYPLAPEHPGLPKIHSRRFRDYCSQMLSKEVDACVTDLLKELVRFQDRMYQKDPVKAKTKRRVVLGLREVLKHLKLKKLKCVIISPNCEKIQSKGGLDDTLHTIIAYACAQNIPFVFALNRKALGRSLNKAVPVSVVGIFSYDGAQDQFHKMVELTMEARQAYRSMLESARQELAGEPGLQAPPQPPVQGPRASSEGSAPAPTGRQEPHCTEVWRERLEAYSQCALELEESLEASTSQMMSLNL
ncbi:Selenocysteine insertion sequence-binding protein 2 [Tupaia chinensis]|uniref:Cyclin-dependent kinases regulatory subunit n=1 Tax=Tupaia chinensis TaxID=246437 RepID=L9KKZ7_TUPCH|nr:Selenocysteine insertion sequence-binding protein 2 [Tupaia chinensis]